MARELKDDNVKECLMLVASPTASRAVAILHSLLMSDKDIITLDLSWKECGEFAGDLTMPVIHIEWAK